MYYLLTQFGSADQLFFLLWTFTLTNETAITDIPTHMALIHSGSVSMGSMGSWEPINFEKKVSEPISFRSSM